MSFIVLLVRRKLENVTDYFPDVSEVSIGFGGSTLLS